MILRPCTCRLEAYVYIHNICKINPLIVASMHVALTRYSLIQDSCRTDSHLVASFKIGSDKICYG